jgi:hypothetical protein
MRRGLYRIHGLDGLPDDVRVEDDGIEMPLEETLYRTRGYLPDVDDLPWKEEYLGGKSRLSSGIRPSETTDKAARVEARREFLDRFRKA